MDRSEGSMLGNGEERPKNGLDVPKPVVARTSPCSSPYFKKLPPLSPRSLKMIDPNYNYTEFTYPKELTSSSESAYSSYDSEYSTTPGEGQSAFDFGRKASTSSNAEDIDFFLQVVGVFREYTSDQIDALEGKMKENQGQLETLQRNLKLIENEADQQEKQLKRDVAHSISMLHRRQSDLCDKLKIRNQKRIGDHKEQMEVCRRNLKLISGVLSFAKRLRSESEESLRENAVRELKQRLTMACELQTPDLPTACNTDSRIPLNSVERFIEQIDFSIEAESSPLYPVILAAHPDDEISSNCVVVRWHYRQLKSGSYELKWWYLKRGIAVENFKDGILEKQHTVTDLPWNSKIFFKVRFCGDSTENWSEVGCFTTSPAPAKFSFDMSTAHSKLQLSSDANTVFYPGEQNCASSSPKSPSRFTFALNVLGNISFFSGRHYWEVAVNRDGWAVGVASRNIARNSWLGSNEVSWILHYNAAKFEYKVRSGGEAFVVTPKLSDPRQFLKRVGVFLDYDAGIIRFTDCKNEEILYTYTVEYFSDPLCAAVNPFYHGGGLTLLSGLRIPKYLL